MENNDRPDVLPIEFHACVLACAFICPYQIERNVQGVYLASCERFKVDLRVTKATLAGTLGERHPIKVGVRTWECQRTPPQFVIVDQRSKPKKRSKQNAVDKS